jgi:hypothetical protein
MEQFQMELKQLQSQMRQLKVSGGTTSLFIHDVSLHQHQDYSKYNHSGSEKAQNAMQLTMKIMIQPLRSAMWFSVLHDEHWRERRSCSQ